MSNAAPAMTQIRTEVAAATTQSTNHYTITASHGETPLPLLFSQEHPFPSSIETGTLFPVFI